MFAFRCANLVKTSLSQGRMKFSSTANMAMGFGTMSGERFTRGVTYLNSVLILGLMWMVSRDKKVISRNSSVFDDFKKDTDESIKKSYEYLEVMRNDLKKKVDTLISSEEKTLSLLDKSLSVHFGQDSKSEAVFDRLDKMLQNMECAAAEPDEPKVEVFPSEELIGQAKKKSPTLPRANGSYNL